MPKINQEEYEVLKELDDKWRWIARGESSELSAYRSSPYRSEYGRYWVAKTAWEEHHLDVDLFRFIKWTDEEPYNIAELIEEYEKESHIKQVLEIYEGGFRNVREAFIKLSKAFSEESEETEVKNIEWAKEKLFERAWEENLAEYLIHLKDVYEVINQLDEPEPQNITLQDIMHRLWKLPLNNRKYWLEQLNDEFKEGYIVPLGLKTTDGEEQYLTLNGSYFASRRNRYLQQTFATLEEIPEFYRDLAERVL